MRIKAVLRDSEILKMEAASDGRILAAAKKNVDRPISWSSLLKVMGLTYDDRTRMLDSLKHSGIHIWLVKDGQQDLIFLSEGTEGLGYQWQ